MSRLPRRLALAAGLLLAASLSCGGDGASVTTPTPPAPTSGPGARIVTARSVEDTIGATLAGGLTVEVHDSTGALAVARKVTIGSHLDVLDPFRSPVASFALSPGASGVDVLSEVTNASGQLTVASRLVEFVTSGWITVDAGTLGRDSIHVVVRPGAPARLAMQPRDTAIAVGVSYTPAMAIDRATSSRARPCSRRDARRSRR